jgi:hypothetical protein
MLEPQGECEMQFWHRQGVITLADKANLISELRCVYCFKGDIAYLQFISRNMYRCPKGLLAASHDGFRCCYLTFKAGSCCQTMSSKLVLEHVNNNRPAVLSLHPSPGSLAR